MQLKFRAGGSTVWPSIIILAIVAASCTNASSPELSSTTKQTTVVTTEETTTTEVEVETTTTAAAPTIESGFELANAGADVAKVTVANVIAHDFGAHTQGLVKIPEEEFLIEGTGLYGSSERRRVKISNGNPSENWLGTPDAYNTDLTIVGEEGFHFTARENYAEVFDLEKLRETRRVQYQGTVWGACAIDGGGFFTSDGTATITRRNSSLVESSTFSSEGQDLLALECLEDQIWAVQGETNTIAVLSSTGTLVATINLAEIVPATVGSQDSLSAIAYNPETETVFVTGKRWGVIYELDVEF